MKYAMTNICMIAKDRPRLTQQALDSLTAKPSSLYNLTLIDDGSLPEAHQYYSHNKVTVRLSSSKGIVGFVRNLSIKIAEQYWGRGDFLYLSDNDIFFKPYWLEQMVQTLELVESSGVKVLGGARHPYHGVNQSLVCGNGSSVSITDAVAGYSHLMRWETWDKYGPFDAHQLGVGMSEDFAFCQKIVKDGGYVGYIESPVLVNCGLTNSLGQPAVGSEAFPRIEGLIQE